MADQVTTGARTTKSHAYFAQTITLNSLHAQQVFDRGFEICASAIYSLSVVLRIVGSEVQAGEVEAIVDDRLRKTTEDVRAENARLEKLAESNGIAFQAIAYTHPKVVDARINSPRAVRYLGLIREFDNLVTCFDALWLSGVITDGNYSQAVYGWKRRLLRLAGSIRGLSNRAIVAARRGEADQEDDKAESAYTAETPSSLGESLPEAVGA